MSFTAVQAVDSTLTVASLQVRDVSRDGRPDLVIGGRMLSTSGDGNGREVVRVLESAVATGSGVAAFPSAVDFDLRLGGSAVRFELADMDSDGDLDIIAQAATSLFLLRDVASAIAADPPTAFLERAFEFGAEAFTVADLDGDGRPDGLLLGAGSGDVVRVLRNEIPGP